MQFSRKFVSRCREYTSFCDHVPAPYLRRSFTASAGAKAEVTICGLGFYELFINGEKITKGLLAPYISNPDDILYYDNYDLTPYLREGENVLGMLLGNGMLNNPGGEIWDFEKADFRSAPKAAFALEITEDGKTAVIEADSAVKCAPSPIVLDDLRIGEWYDARLEIPGWNLPGFDDSQWTDAIPAETPRGKGRLCAAEPILPREEIAPVSIRQSRVGGVAFRPSLPVITPPDDETGEGWLYDFGVNTAGLVRLKIHGEPGQKITLQFGEALMDDGTLDLRGMTFTPERYNHRDMYICRGGEEEIWMPCFTYHGFQYVLVYGLKPEQATKDLLTYVVYASALDVIAEFESSDEMANKLWKAGMVSNLANFYYFPTDCPHREKNGWTADAALSTEQMLLTITPENSYREWMHNIRAAQAEDGSLPGIIPTSGWGFAWGNGPAWDSVSVILPYYTWKYRGETAMIEENASMLLRYLAYVANRRDERGLIHIGLGDWCPAGRSTPLAPLEFTDTVMVLDYAAKAGEMLEAVGMETQASLAWALFDELYDTCRTLLIDTDTMTAYGACQATQAMAIYYDLFTDAEKPAAAKVLVDMIHEDGGSMDVGVLGARVIFHVLSRFGYTDLAWHMIHKEDYPSYGNWIVRGATSLWEDFHPEGSRPNSRNHHFFGDILSWYIRYVCGIRVNPNGEGPDTVLIRGEYPTKLTWARGSHILPAGKVSTDWKREDEDIVLSVVIPAGVKGTMEAPAGYKFSDGFRVRPAATGEYRLIPLAKKDSHRAW